MSHKKKSKSQSIKEALKAQKAVGREFYQSAVTTGIASNSNINANKDVSNTIAGEYFLSIKEIKKDLIKNGVFALFSIALIIVLKLTSFGFVHFTL